MPKKKQNSKLHLIKPKRKPTLSKQPRTFLKGSSWLVLISFVLFSMILMSCQSADMPDAPKDLQAKYLYLNPDNNTWSCELFTLPQDPNADPVDAGPCDPSSLNKSFDFSAGNITELKQYIKNLNTYITNHCQ